MDAIAKIQDTDIQKVIFPTIGILAPLLEPKREEIVKARKSFQYGDTERHQLDVYYPPTTGKPHPVLIFIYGGGFVTGARRLPAPADLVYGNVGLYFAQRGFAVVVPDYRLVPDVKFPAPAEDVRDALAWVISHATDLGPDVDVSKIFILGHSAGGVHALTLLLHPPVLASTPGLLKHVKGVGIGSAPYHFGPFPAGEERRPTDMYYGSPETAAAHDPLGLLKSAPQEVLSALPPLALIKIERDPDVFQVVRGDWDASVAEKGLAPSPKHIFAAGHNHISFSLALGTGQGEEWAEEFAAWMKGLSA